MKSYVISVSFGTGCYRHIQISSSASLYKLHESILNFFEFVDDHMHAFFMDNKCWSRQAAFFSERIDGGERLTKDYKLKDFGLSKGSQFKYVFDFGEEWRFQCKVLREIEEKTDIPRVLRSVGEASEQYGSFDDYDDFDLEEDDEEDDGLPAYFPPELLQTLFKALPVPMNTIDDIHKYFEAASRLYGIIPVGKLMEIYNSQNTPIDEELFLQIVCIIRHEEETPFYILGKDEIDEDADSTDPINWEIIDSVLLDEDDADYRAMVRMHRNKPYKILPKAEFLPYADPDYFPVTPQNSAMKRFLRSNKSLKRPDAILILLQGLVEIGFTPSEVMAILNERGLTFENITEIGEFTRLYQELSNHTRMQANRGHTPIEMAAKYSSKARTPQEGQLSLYDMLVAAETKKEKQPSKNGPCPCGSGKKYKRCCGKEKP